MNRTTTTAMAALAALCLLPAASADWGPDVSVTLDTQAIDCATNGQDRSVGPASVAADDCSATVLLDLGFVWATCGPERVPPAATMYVELRSDCDVHVQA